MHLCAAQQSPLGGVLEHARQDDVVGRLGRVDDLAHEDEPERSGMALLVGPEEAPQQAGALLVVHPPDADQVGHILHAEGGAHGGIGTLLGEGGLLHAQADEDLRRGRHAEARRDEGALTPAVEGEPPAAREQVVEERQVQRRLLVRRRMQDGARRHQRQPAHRRVVEVGVEGEDVGVTGRHRLEQRGRTGTLQVDPALHVGGSGVGRILSQSGPERVEVLVAAGRRADAVHAHAVHLGRALGQLVAPRDGVEGTRRQHVDVEALVRHQTLGQHARPRLGAAADGGAVARDHEGDLHVCRAAAGSPRSEGVATGTAAKLPGRPHVSADLTPASGPRVG